MFSFSEQTRQILEAAGWTDGRYVDTCAYAQGLAANGLPVFPEALEFLAHFGGLLIPHPTITGPNTLDTTLEYFIDVEDPMWVRNCLADIETSGIPMTPIGIDEKDFANLSIDEQGSIYVRYELSMYKFPGHWPVTIEIYLSPVWEKGTTVKVFGGDFL